MNNPNSMALGWGSLLFAGGIAYYYAKKDINDRRDREHKKRLSHTSGVTNRTQFQTGASSVHSGAMQDDPSMQAAEMSQEQAGGEAPKYRIAKGGASQGRDRGDRL